MADVFDQIHQQSQAAPSGGDVFDQIHAGNGTPSSQPPESPSLGGFLHNTLRSAGNFVGDLAGPLLHPARTLEGVTGLLEGMSEKSGNAPIGSGLPEAQQNHGRYVDALVKMYSDRYGSFDNFKKTLYEDPIGVLSDVAALTSAGGGLAKGTELAADAAKLPRVANAAGKVADVADVASRVSNPISLAGSLADVTGAAAKTSQFANWAARKLNAGALRGGYTVVTDPEQVLSMADTLTRNGGPFSRAGLQQMNQAITDLQTAKEAKLSGAARAGLTIDPTSVASYVDPVRAKFAAQANPDADLRSIDKVKATFLRNNPSPIPANTAEAIKEGTYAQNQYGDKIPQHLIAESEAEKAIARGLMQNIGMGLPEVADINEGQAKLLQLQPTLEKAVNKYVNSGGFLASLKKGMATKAGLSMAGVGTGAAIASHNPELAGAGFAAQIMTAVLSDPAVKSRLARGIEFGRQANPAKYGAAKGLNGMARINEYVTSLNQ